MRAATLVGGCFITVIATPSPLPPPRAPIRSSAPRRLQVSIDLISGLPFQTMDSWKASLDAAAELSQVGHISVYDLQVRQLAKRASHGPYLGLRPAGESTRRLLAKGGSRWPHLGLRPASETHLSANAKPVAVSAANATRWVALLSG